ncbi:hypothetical protein EDB84DRAFT_1501473 [Lactarius hengduanensis]|nr:hypothetical protein EDB84DRAFT_1501473 [Lactarius hengduanensis]
MTCATIIVFVLGFEVYLQSFLRHTSRVEGIKRERQICLYNCVYSPWYWVRGRCSRECPQSPRLRTDERRECQD